MTGYAAPLFVAVFTIPFIIEGMGTDRFGVLTLAWIFFSYMGLLDFGLSRALTKIVAERLGSGSEQEIPSIIRSALFLMLITGVIILFCVFPILPYLIEHGLNIHSPIYTETLQSFRALTLFTPLLLVSIGMKGVLDAHQRFDLSNSVRIPFGIYTFVSPLFILPFSQSLYPILLAFLAGRFIVCAVQLVFCIRIVPGLFSKASLNPPEIVSLIRFGGWMTISNVVNPVIVYIDRFLISSLISVTAVAYYATPSEIVTKLLMISGAMIAVFFPAFSTSCVQNKAHMLRLFTHGLHYLVLIMFPPTFFIAAFSMEGLTLWIDAEFARNSAIVLQTLAAGVFVLAMGQLPGSLIQGSGRPDLTAKLHIIELPVYLLLLTASIKMFGINGAAAAWLIRNSADTLILFAISKNIPAERQTNKRFRFVIAFICLSFAVTFGLDQLSFKIIHFITTLFIFGILSWTVLLDRDARERVKNRFGRKPASAKG